jgi:aerobic-type carbon monoxide dehydrogenase small subunit (CoxS/CutS family)
MAAITLSVNGKKHSLEVDPKMPLLWVIRDYLKLTGTKYGCGISQCGSCTVHLNGNAVRSCTVPVNAARDAEILTIEGLSTDATHPLQKAWIEEQVPQCGYCQSGQIMAAAALLKRNPHPSDEEIGKGMQNVICRCGTYPRIKKAIQRAASYT